MAAPRPHREDRLVLDDGRHLGFAEYGDPEGRPILWFHGTPGARRQLPPDAGDEAASRGMRIVTLERPGAGWSTPHRFSNVREWSGDVARAADVLDIEHFAVVGLSGGGPYVLACAHDLPDRVSVAAVLGGIGPVTGDETAPGITRLLPLARPFLTLVTEPLAALLSNGLKLARPFGSQAFDLYATLGPRSDRPVLRRPEMKEVFLDDILHAADCGMRSPVYDLVLFSRHWGFSLRDIDVPVRFWQGDADLVVPSTHCHHQGDLVPDSEVFVQPGEGHFAGYTCVADVLDVIDRDWDVGRRSGTNTGHR